MILAAGLGSRFRDGGGEGMKVLTPVRGRPIVAHVVARAVDAGLRPVVIVVGPELSAEPGIQEVLATHGGTDVRLVINERPEVGIGGSLACGLTALLPTREVAACMVLLGDQPDVDPDVIASVTAAWARSGLPARTRYHDGVSHPVLLPRDIWPELIGASAGTDIGARRLLDSVGAVEVEVDAPAPVDVDVPEDLHRLMSDRGHGE